MELPTPSLVVLVTRTASPALPLQPSPPTTVPSSLPPSPFLKLLLQALSLKLTQPQALMPLASFQRDMYIQKPFSDCVGPR